VALDGRRFPEATERIGRLRAVEDDRPNGPTELPMRYHCWFCHKSVTSELPDDSVVRAILVCPECIQAKRIEFPEDPPTKEDS
jgi:hypothetical protein